MCEKIVTPRGALICRDCKKELRYIKQPSCMRCGRQLSYAEHEYCSECAGKRFSYDRGYAVWQYDARMRHSLGAFKYHSKREYADFYVTEAVRLYGDRIRAQAPEVLIPVPIHCAKRKQRGFNQAECLAERLGAQLGIPVDAGCLVRHKKTMPLKELGAKERARELHGAFRIREKVAPGYRSVMLVDDIYTTGNTLEECAAVLKKAGVQKITFLCIAIGATGNKNQKGDKAWT